MNNNESEKKSWFALYTKPKHEFKASEQLSSNDIEHYLPLVTRIKQWSDRKKKVTEPILPGYIFILADERERLLALEQNAIVRCLFDRGKAARIPEWQITNLKCFLQEEYDYLIENSIVPGTFVLIEEGPFRGVTGIVVEKDNDKFLNVSIDILNRTVVAQLPKDSKYSIRKPESIEIKH